MSGLECLNAISERLITYAIGKSGGKGLSDRELYQNFLHDYLSHGGSVLTGKPYVTASVCLKLSFCADWIPKLLLNTSEPWLVQDLSSLQICLIGALAHEDPVFCNHLKEILARYRSYTSPGRAVFAENLFQTTFGKASIERHFQALDSLEMYELLSLICRTGSAAMVKLFMSFGLEINGGNWHENMLGNAVAGGKMNIVRILLESGANGFLAIRFFIRYSQDFSDIFLRNTIEMLIENAIPASIDLWNDPCLAIFESNRVHRCYPRVFEHLLDRNSLGSPTSIYLRSKIISLYTLNFG